LKSLSDLRYRGLLYLEGIRHLWRHPNKINGLINDDFGLIKQFSAEVIGRVKNPLNWFYSIDILQLSAEQCHLRVGMPKWTHGNDKVPVLRSSILYGAEQALHLFWENALSYGFYLQLNKVEMVLKDVKTYPVEIAFSMDKSDRNEVDWELKTKGSHQIGVSLNLLSQNKEVGYVYFLVELKVPKSLSSNL